jgi:hypothetical protein
MGLVRNRRGMVKPRLDRNGCTAMIIVVLGAALVAPSSAVAGFTRPFLRQIAPETGLAGGIATDAEDDLWIGVGSYPEVKLDEYGPAYSSSESQLLQTLNLGSEAFTAPHSLAIEQATGHIYVSGNEAFVPEFGELEHNSGYLEVFENNGSFLRRSTRFKGTNPSHVAINSDTTDPMDPSRCSPTCTVYISHEEPDPSQEAGGDAEPAGIGDFNANLEPVDFTAAGKVAYVTGNEIDGTPPGLTSCEGENFDSLPPGTTAIAVDPTEGSIYALVLECPEGVVKRPVVLEYSPSGQFMRIVVTGVETPGLAGSNEFDGFGGAPYGLAFDPVSGHLLVSIHNFNSETGAVDEFEAASGRYLDQITETNEGEHLRFPAEMTVDSHGDLYVADSETGVVDIYAPGKVLPNVRLGGVTDRTKTTAVLSGAVDPESSLNEGLGLSECHFQYVTEEAFSQNVEEHEGKKSEGFTNLTSGGEVACVPAAAFIEHEDTYQLVHNVIGGLISGTSYYYRLVAKTAGVSGGSDASAALAFIAPSAPKIETTSSDDISSTSVDLRAKINPLGADTSYHFEYDLRAYAGEERHGVSVPLFSGAIGSGGPTGNSSETVLQHIEGLMPDIKYNFRIVAESEIDGEVETSFGPNETFSTLPNAATGLPDNRAYELVTPANKEGSNDMFAESQTDGEYTNSTNVGYASEAGDEFLLETDAAFGSFPGAGESAYIFSRDPTKSVWADTSLASPSLGVQSLQASVVFDPSNLSLVGINDILGAEAEQGAKALEGGGHVSNLVGSPGGPYATLNVDPPVSGFPAGTTKATYIVGASRNLSHVILESAFHTVCAGAEAQDANSRVLCEWTGGQNKLVNVSSAGSLLSKCGARLGVGTTGGGAHGAVSADGSKVFFTAPDPGMHFNPVEAGATDGCWNQATGENAPQLYMRVDGKTVQLSAPEAGVDEEGHSPVERPVAYVGASEDGSKVFFVTETELTKDDEGVHDPELYEYDTETTKLIRVSAGEQGPGAGAELRAVPVVSANGGAVYFTAFAALADGAEQLSPTSIAAEEEAPINLYRYETESGTISYVATVNTNDYAGNASCATGFGLVSGVLCPDVSWYATPDGRYLLFSSGRQQPGTGYMGGGSCPIYHGQGERGPCAELYRYDAQAAEKDEPAVVCVSCDPSGAPPVSNAEFSRSAPTGPAAGPVRAMSDNGEYVFFDTADALVPQDNNGTLDVYEWHEGQIALISSGTDSAPSFFLGASADGSNVFIGTHARLVSQDTDSLGDVYDARICEPNDPCITSTPDESAQCEGDACQNPPPLPSVQTPATFTLASSGNVLVPALVAKPKAKSPARAQKLTAALKLCKHEAKKKRVACERTARKRYGPAKAMKSRKGGKANV